MPFYLSGLTLRSATTFSIMTLSKIAIRINALSVTSLIVAISFNTNSLINQDKSAARWRYRSQITGAKQELLFNEPASASEVGLMNI